MNTPIHPTYFIRHPDGSYSIAAPQPTQEQIARQRNIYAQCDRKHGGSCCEDPNCYRRSAESMLHAAAQELLAELAKAADQLQGWVNWKCPEKHVAEHEAYIAGIRALIARAGGGL